MQSTGKHLIIGKQKVLIIVIGHWPQATTYTEKTIGVDNQKAYMNFREKFAGAGASFIWPSNVVLDNKVLLKYRVK